MNLMLIGGVIIAILTAALGVQTWRLDATQEKLAVEKARHQAFVAQVTQLGKEAQEKAAKQEKANTELQKRTEAEHAKRYASLDAQYAAYRLRQRAANSASRSFMPVPAADSPSDSPVCYSREAVDREIRSAFDRLREEYRRLRGELANDVEPYDQAAVIARSCRDWALKIGQP